jgi:Xaa-Pro aminopeptidase
MTEKGFEKQPLPFEMSEFDRRMKRVREEMAGQGVDVLMVFKPENYFYLTAFQGAYYAYVCLILPIEGEPIFVVPALEELNVLALTWVKRTAPYSVFAPPPLNDPAAHTAQVLKEEGFDKKRIGIELGSWWQTPAQYEQLQKALPSSEFVDASGLIDGVRVIKSEPELACIRKAGEILTDAMYEGINAIMDGRTENDIASKIVERLMLRGSDPASFWPTVSSGPRTALPHNVWAGRRFKPGDPIFIEFGGVVNRYHATMMRTAVIGPPSKELKEMFDVTCEALNRGIEAVKPGVTSGEVDGVVRGTIRKAGYGDCFRHRSAYTIGIGFPPSWVEAPFIKENDPAILQPGMVFHMVPVVFRHNMGIGLSEPIAVTEKGCQVLASVERKLFIR